MEEGRWCTGVQRTVASARRHNEIMSQKPEGKSGAREGFLLTIRRPHNCEHDDHIDRTSRLPTVATLPKTGTPATYKAGRSRKRSEENNQALGNVTYDTFDNGSFQEILPELGQRTCSIVHASCGRQPAKFRRQPIASPSQLTRHRFPGPSDMAGLLLYDSIQYSLTSD
jgi:hypothetical protein